MSDFKQKFIADALDLLKNMEKAVLSIETQKNDSGLIEEIFRGMHTLKGAGAMYGFKSIEKLVHLLENVYDLIRDGSMSVSKGIIDLTFKVIDHLNRVLKSSDIEDEKNIKQNKILCDEIQTLLRTVNDYECDDKIETPYFGSETGILKTFYILFKPEDDFQKKGVTLNTIFDDIKVLGNALFYPGNYHNVPQKIQKKEIEMFWEILLVTDEDISEIEDVLFFFQEDPHIIELASSDLLKSKEFIKTFEEKLIFGEPVNTKELEKAIEELLYEDKDGAIQTEKKETISDNSTIFLKVDAEKVDEQMNLLSELVTAKAELKLITDREKYKKLTKVVETIDKITNNFRKNILTIRLIPIEALYLVFLRLVRDISGQLNKEVEFIAEGLDTELDKNIIDSLEGPLTHIIRNSMDHGIEPPNVRETRGKPRKGIIKLKAYHSAANIFIEISDDGEGINNSKIIAKAVEKGLIEKDVDLSEKEIVNLIFAPGFSTAQNLTEVSGRGVGMDIVKKGINKLRGEIEVLTEKGKGTTMVIKLPVTLSIMDTMLVTSGNSYYSIPLTSIQNCTQISHKELISSDNKQITIDGKLTPYIHLRDVFNHGDDFPEKEKVVMVKSGNKTVGLIVDKVIGEHQAVLKPLGDFFEEQEYFSGITVLADGKLAVILDTNKLIQDKVIMNN